jgi:aldehyde dehydrogenase (NAD+)
LTTKPVWYLLFYCLILPYLYEDIIKKANDTIYGLAAYVFSQNINRAIETAHKLKAGTVWVNSGSHPEVNVPFGGYKQSGIGRELGQKAIDEYVMNH